MHKGNSLKAYLVTLKTKNGDKLIGIVSNKKPTKDEILMQNRYAFSKEMRTRKFGVQGYTPAQVYKQRLETLKDDFENEQRNIIKGKYTIVFVQEV